MSDGIGPGPGELRGLVLAGGQSRRMGRDKATLKIGGRSQLERAADLLAEYLGHVHLSVRADQFDNTSRFEHEPIIDAYDELGPAAGLLSAHRAYPEVAWLVLACDMPLVDGTIIRALIEQRDSRKAATAFANPRDGLPEPLCAIYEPGTLARFRRLAEEGLETSPRTLLVQSELCELELPRSNALDNINTPEDLARISDLLA
jgi:molybdopterin-guanine dinucleotide biosynthesis protein A